MAESEVARKGTKRAEKRMKAGAANLRNCMSNPFTALGVKRGTPKAGFRLRTLKGQ